MNPIHPARTAQEKWAARALATLSAHDPDGATEINGVGFNKTDGDFGHSLNDMLTRRGGLTSKQWNAAIKICGKYWRQVGECPIDPPAPPPPVHLRNPEAAREQVELEAGEVSSRERDQAGRTVDLHHFRATGTPWIKPHDDGSSMTAEEWRDFDVRR